MQLGAWARGAGCVALAAAVASSVPAHGQLREGLAMFVLIGGLWVTQALPLAVTALAVPLLAVLAGVMPVRQALAPFAHPVIFLFLGGFALGAALARQGLDRALARAVLRAARGHRLAAALLLGGLCALLSMWMSNTATAAMMLPLALSLLQGGEAEQASRPTAETSPQHPVGGREQAFVLLVLAYSASIGGIATLVGSPPNAIVAAQLNIGFAQWLRIGLPLALLLWPAMVVVLWVVLRPSLGGRVTLAAEPLEWTRERCLTVVIFLLTAAGWVAGAPLAAWLGVTGEIDTLVGLVAMVALTLSGALGWKDIERHTQWGVLLLFGGGLALSDIMASTGASSYLATGLLAVVRHAPPALLLLGMVTFVVLLTEMVSNTASAALLLPVFLPVAAAIDLPPLAMGAAIAVAASCAFMLPVATPPNALVFSTSLLPQGTMMRCGLWLNAVCIVTITTFASGVWA
ncbi:SLC13 family permease [Paracidovorax sp. MALMAid1276]|uniref:SLC13 family permease n=1 Tax=Paracidovorax sp. MALMAid1276 TaxID=3411631 RepID=UPI003B9B7AF5